jgi:monovalent cation:proton antiporter-2 (CPA2) family protein
MSSLAHAAIFLAAAVIAVPLFRRFRLGAVLGYLTAGVVIGPWGLSLIEEVESTMQFAELGVVLLLFVIGLELQPSRLWVLRKPVFGLGSAQVVVSTVLLGAIGLALGLTGRAAFVVGFGLAMSSTAFVLQVLAERNQLTARHGRSAFAILLFQDLSVIPLLALLPMLGSHVPDSGVNPWLAALKAVAVVAAVVLGGRFLLRPVFKIIAATRVPEIFTTATLLTVIGTALLMTSAGLSMSLGAFLAGVVLADSEFRHELEADIEPFKGLLLGLFFITVGMSANLGLLREHPLAIVAAALGLMLTKAIVVFIIGRLSHHATHAARGLSVALAQGGEFAFVLFSVAASERIIDRNLADSLTIVVTLSMALTPLAFMLNDRWESSRKRAPTFDEIDDAEPSVIIAGFGRVGAVIGRVLRAKKIAFTALDSNAEQIELVRRFGARAYYGDASRLDLLTAAGAGSAKLLILAMDDVEASLKTAELARKHFPHLTILARARNRFHAYRLMDLGVEKISRETFLSTLELAEWTLQAAGLNAWQAQQSIHRFKDHDEQLLQRQHAVYHDESKLMQTTKEAMQEMETLLESDRDDAKDLDSTTFSPSDVR